MEKLGIDPRLLFSQVVNFFILYILLKKLLYKPIIKLLEDRKKAIEQTAQNLNKSNELLEKAQADQKKIVSQANKDVSVILASGQEAGKKHAEEILENARQEAQKVISHAQEQSNRMVEEVVKIVQKRTGKMVVEVTQNVLKDLDEETQHKVIQSVIKKLK